LQQKHQRAA